ncbi:hypothetical protein ACPCUK_35785 [Streptomyces arboris]|uniref:hypothetical protein n=1 Tax=Streptomyces arboris TaxID=2600619 RepID=UPI003C2FDED0
MGHVVAEQGLADGGVVGVERRSLADDQAGVGRGGPAAVTVVQPVGGDLVGEFLQVQGVPSEAAADDEGAACEVQVAGEDRAQFMDGHGMDGGKDEDQTPEGSLRLPQRVGQQVAGDRLGDACRAADAKVLGGVAEDHSFPFQCPEQAAQAEGELPAGPSGLAVHGRVDVVPGNLSKREHSGLCPSREHGLEGGQVRADRVVAAGLALVAPPAS